MSENPSWCPQSVYVPYADIPHIMFSMRHHIDDELVVKDEEHQEELLRGELMAITATMLTRLERFAPEGHIYIPVRSLPFNFFQPFSFPNLSTSSFFSFCVTHLTAFDRSSSFHSWAICGEEFSRHTSMEPMFPSGRQSFTILGLQRRQGSCLVGYFCNTLQILLSVIPRRW